MLSNGCAMPTLQQPTPAPGPPSTVVPAAAASTVVPSLASVPQQAPPSTCSFAPCPPTSEPTAVPPKVKKDGEKKKRSTKSNSSKSGSKSHSSNGGEAASKSEKSRIKSDSFDRKERRKKHKHHKDGEMHSSKCTSKEGSKHTEPPDKKLKISSNMTAKVSIVCGCLYLCTLSKFDVTLIELASRAIRAFQRLVM
uniref:Round spermatid basic protein 1-like protein n=1 Tax=Rhipicephalus zambeziensis TaxID=60191 RepID=A0A224YEL0_9ACAR